MCGRAFDPRFLYTWPSAKSAVMGGQQLADVVTSVAAAASAARGQEMDQETIDGLKTAIADQIEKESLPAFLSGMLYDDGVIDPRDTRTVLGLSLSAIHSGEVAGTDRFGVFRM
jgi:acetyl-CoA carboxylase carboxyltransferase component